MHGHGIAPWLVAASLAASLAGGCSGGSDDDDLRTAQGFLAGPTEQAQSTAESGVTATATGTQTIPADRAVLVVSAPYDEFSGSGGEFEESDRAALTAAAAELGYDADSITVTSPAESERYFGGGDELRVTIAPEEAARRADELVDAAEDVVDDLGPTGVRFFPSDCTAALAALEESTVADALADARALAAAADLDAGELVAVREAPTFAGGFGAFGLPGLGACPDGTSGPLVDPETPPEVELHFEVEVTIAVPEGVDGIRGEVLGSGSITVPADTASVVVLVAPDEYDLESPISLTGEDREEVRTAVGGLGLDPAAVRFQLGDDLNGIATMIIVPIDLGRLEDGDDIVDAVGDAIDEPVEGGAVFAASECPELLERARRLALDDAEHQLAGLGQGAPGPYLRVAEQPTNEFGLTPAPCDPAAVPMSDYGFPDLADFDGRPEVTVSAAVAVARVLG